MSKKKVGWKKIVAAGVITTSLGLGFWASKASYTVASVIDGDTFITKQEIHIRLDSVDAPELGNCLGKEAKAELEKLILGKKVYLKITYINNWRLVASVFTSEGNVGAKMLEKGLATFADKANQSQPGLLEISQKARKEGVGVYSPKCTQSVNTANPKCNIKVNISQRGNFYYYPGCRAYNIAKVQLHLGDKWFCTTAEAKNEGFAKSETCP